MLVQLLGVLFSTLVLIQAIVANRRVFYAVAFGCHSVNIITQLLAGTWWLLPFAVASLLQTLWSWLVMERDWKQFQTTSFSVPFGLFMSGGAIAVAHYFGAEEHLPFLMWIAIPMFFSAVSYLMPNIALIKIFQIIATAPWPLIYILSGIPASSIGDMCKLILLTWSLIEIWRARRRAVDFERIEQANLPWKIRKLYIKEGAE